MNGTRAVIASAFVAVVAMLLVQRRSISRLRVENEFLREQHANLTPPATEEQERALSTGPQRPIQPGSNEQSSEARRLRGEVGRLRRELRELAQAKAELEENLVVTTDWARRKRQLQEWLELEPSENTPELRFATSDDWVRAVLFNPLKTDDDYRRAMSLMRANAASKLINMLYPALRENARAHDGQFPTEVTQLQSYFKTPVDEAVLARYEVLPANKLRGLIQDEELAGFGAWVITERIPVNQALDDRWFMGLTNILGTTRVSAPNRWGSTSR